MAVSFIGGGNRSTRRKPPTCRKSLANFILKCCIDYTSSERDSNSLNPTTMRPRPRRPLTCFRGRIIDIRHGCIIVVVMKSVTRWRSLFLNGITIGPITLNRNKCMQFYWSSDRLVNWVTSLNVILLIFDLLLQRKQIHYLRYICYWYAWFDFETSERYRGECVQYAVE